MPALAVGIQYWLSTRISLYFVNDTHMCAILYTWDNVAKQNPADHYNSAAPGRRIFCLQPGF